MEEFVARHKAGPIGTVFLRKQGSDPLSPATIVVGLVHNFVSSLIVGALLVMALPALASFGKRVLFVAVVGAFAAFTVGLSTPIWLQHPWGYSLFNAAHIVSAWSIAGLILAKAIRA